MIKQVKVTNFEKFSVKVDGINKKLKRANKDLVTFTVVGEERFQLIGRDQEEHIITESTPLVDLSPVYVRKIIDVDIPELFSVIDGWQFIAKITFLGEANIVTTPGEAIEGFNYEKYATIKPFCHHCNARKPRQKSLVFMNTTTKEEIQIGTRCASLYFGVDLDSSINLIEILSNFCSSVSGSDSDEEYYGGSRLRTDRFHSVLRAALFLMRKYGFVSRKAADSWRKASTLDDAWMLAFPISPGAIEHMRGENPEYFTTDCHEQLDKLLFKFLSDTQNKSIQGLSDFDRNAIVAIQACSERFLNFAIPYMKNYFDMQNQQFEKKLESFHVGTVGDKIEVNAIIDTIRDIGDYYSKWLVKMHTPEGAQITWFASSRPDSDINEGSAVSVRARVKGHDEYKGVKQTIITRANVSLS